MSTWPFYSKIRMEIQMKNSKLFTETGLKYKYHVLELTNKFQFIAGSFRVQRYLHNTFLMFWIHHYKYLQRKSSQEKITKGNSQISAF
jgi:G:T-mismatch repair DNA endonuclease (very short patch repair protein)